MYKLVKYEDNYADEFDIVGFKIMTEQEYFEWRDMVEKSFLFDEDNQVRDTTDREFYFGTNEFVTYQNANQYFDQLEVIDLANHEAAALLSMFAKEIQYGYGTFIDPADY